MQDSRKKFSCPKCHGVVKVPLKYLGKRIKCPKCAFVFRAGAKPVEEEIVAELDDDEPSMPAPSFMDPMQTFDAPPVQPLVSSRPLPPSRPVTPYRSQIVKKPTRQSANRQDEMTEFDTNLQSSGIFLLILPVIATVLPLAGLQLRRLAKLGEFAPLGAMAAGLIGVGMICYARRNQGDAPLLGSAAALFVLATGIGGFFMVSAMSPSVDESDRFSEQSFDRSDDLPGTNAADAMARTEAAREQFAQDAQNMRDQHDKMREESDRMMREAQEQHRKAMESMQGGGFNNPPGMPPGFPSGASGPPNIPPPNFGGGFGGRRN